MKLIWKAIRKWLSAKVIPMMIFNSWRIFFYRVCGYNIGKKVFIGMRCYLDDMEPNMLVIEDGVTISYGVFMACHGKNQSHKPITIKKNAYIGMRTSIITKAADNQGIVIGENVIVGACSLVDKNIPNNCTAVGVPCKIVKENNIHETND